MRGTQLLRLEGVHRSFDRQRIIALSDVNVTFFSNQSVALVGRSGCGKSCLLNVASGLDRPDAGSVYWQGRRVTSRAEWARLRRSAIGIVFQEFHLIPTLTARQNVELALIGAAQDGRRNDARVDEILDRVGLAARHRSLPAELSGGERQRVAIARALVREPMMLLADEPTGNLDSASADAVTTLLLDAQRERQMSLVIVTHDLSLAARCERLVRMSDGKIIEDVLTDGEPS
jgi:ABC-type lipoprotein export system ATPase subunit